MTERAPEELLATMPPIVARFAVEMSGANFNPSGCNSRFRSSSTQPGSTRAQRPAASISRTRLRYLDVSSTTPGPIDCHGRDVGGRPGQDDAEGHDLIDARVGGIQGPAQSIEADLAGDGLGERGAQA